MWKSLWKLLSHDWLFATLYSPWNSLGQNTGVNSLSWDLSNPGLPHCRWILYQLSNKGSPRILDWVAYLFSSRSSWPRNWTGVSCIGGGFFTTEPSGSPDMFTVCVVLKICSLYGVLYAHSLKNKTKNIVPDLPNEVTYRSYYTNSIYCVV